MTDPLIGRDAGRSGAWEPFSVTGPRPRPLPRESRQHPIRRPIPVLWLAAILPGALVYAVLASLNPILGKSIVGVLLLSLLFVFSTGFMILSPNADRLDAFRVQSLYYLICFCLTPLAVIDPVWHFQRPLGQLVAPAAAFALGAYLMIALGYYFPTFRPLPARIDIATSRTNTGMMTIFALVLIAMGVVSYLVLIVQAGGIARIVGGDESRNQWFKGIGIFFWSTLFLYAGSLLFYAAHAGKGQRRWIAAIPLIMTFSGMLVLQGRGRALNALILLLIASHYLVHPVRLLRLGIFGAAAFVVVVFIGVARNDDVRFLLLQNPLAVVGEVTGKMTDFSLIVLANSFSRLRQLMIIFDKIPGWIPHDWGQSMLAPLNPVLRIVGLSGLQTPSVGPQMFDLAHPEILIDAPTGYLPSIIGEFLWNFPWYLALIPCLLYGMLLRLFYSRLILTRPDSGSVALYAVLMLYFNNMIISDVGPNPFEILVISVPIAISVAIARRTASGPSGFGAAELPTTARPPS